jgi:hypothetical protein
MARRSIARQAIPAIGDQFNIKNEKIILPIAQK